MFFYLSIDDNVAELVPFQLTNDGIQLGNRLKPWVGIYGKTRYINPSRTTFISNVRHFGFLF